MIKRVLALTVVSLRVNALVSVHPASASSKADKQARRVEKLRQGIAALGVGREAVVEVKLRDESRLTGYISESSEDRFLVTNEKSGSSVPVAYADVVKVKGHNLSTGAKVGIGIAIGFALVVLVVFLTRP